MTEQKPTPENSAAQKKSKTPKTPEKKTPDAPLEKEVGGYKDSGLPEPTRFGDWEVKGRCSDF